MRNKMEKENKARYNFYGFTFGMNGNAVLKIEVLNHTENGTRFSTEIGLELTPEEKVELITALVKLGNEN